MSVARTLGDAPSALTGRETSTQGARGMERP
jgi:hypothetical protein